MSLETDFFVISLKHTQAKDLSITLWGPNDCGYRWLVAEAGRYSESVISDQVFGYCDGASTMAVPCSVVEAIASQLPLGHPSRDQGAVVLNTPGNRETLLAAAVQVLVARESVNPPVQPNNFPGHAEAFTAIANALREAEGSGRAMLLAARHKMLAVGFYGWKDDHAEQALTMAERAITRSLVRSGPIPA